MRSATVLPRGAVVSATARFALCVASAATVLVYFVSSVSGVAPGRALSQSMRGISAVAASSASRAVGRAASRAGSNGPDVARVVEQVSHHIETDATQSSSLVVHDAAYTARFAPSGFTLTPYGSNNAFAWSLTRASRDGVASSVAASAWHASTNVATRAVGAAMTERVTARNGNVEWDLVLAQRPTGTGAFVVDAAVTNAAVVSLGEFSVRDAAGAVVLRAPARIVAGHVSLRVPESLLAHARYPLTIDPSVSPAVFVSPTPAKGSQDNPAVAFDGTNYLVVWANFVSGTDEITATRVTKAGTVLDPTGIPIAPAGGAPAVSFDGTNYLVVWQGSVSTNVAVFGTRVSTAGSVLDPSGILISSFVLQAPFDYLPTPQLAFDGTNYLVVWADQRNGADNWDIYGARVTKAGAVLDPNGIAITTAVNNQYQPAIAFGGGTYLVVWTDLRTGGDVYGTRVSKTGAILNPLGIGIAGAAASGSGAVAFDGTNFLVVWTGAHGITGGRVTPAGAILDPYGFPIGSANASGVFSAAVAFDGTNYLAVWNESHSGTSTDIYGARVTPNAAVLDPGGLAIATTLYQESEPRLAFDGTDYLVVSRADAFPPGGADNDDFDVHGVRVGKTGTVLAPGIINMLATTDNQVDAAIAFDGTNYLVVWDDRRLGYDAIYGARVTQAGAPLDPTGFRIFYGTGNQSSLPTVAFDGTNYLVAFVNISATSNADDIYGVRVSTAGAVLDGPTKPIRISLQTNNQVFPAITFNGTDYLVVWHDLRAGSNYDIYGARVTPAGTVLDATGIAISTAAGNQLIPAIAFDGTNSLVVWHDLRGADYDIYGARVDANGTVLDPAGIPISTATGDQYAPALAFDGTNYLVAWRDHRSGTSWDIYGTRVSPAGVVLSTSGTAISTAANDQSFPKVAFNGSYLVVWDDDRSGTRTDVYGARVGTNGTVTDPSGFVIATNVVPGGRLSATKGNGTKWAVTYGANGSTGNAIYMRTVAPK